VGLKRNNRHFYLFFGKRKESPKCIHPSGYRHGLPARDEDHPAGACSRSLTIIMGITSIGAHKIWILSSSE
jgi:hypothetical protein